MSLRIDRSRPGGDREIPRCGGPPTFAKLPVSNPRKLITGLTSSPASVILRRNSSFKLNSVRRALPSLSPSTKLISLIRQMRVT